MNIPTPTIQPNVGREDRVVRGCIALSLMLLGGFTLVGADRLTLVTLGFLVLGGYFLWTAAVGSDPGYQRAGIDTRTDAELAGADVPADPGQDGLPGILPSGADGPQREPVPASTSA